jgi:putative acetyltransferase
MQGEDRMAVVRPETPNDLTAIRQVHAQAFGRPAEARLVDALRARGQVLLSLVAVHDDRVVGHILFSPVTIESAEAAFPAVGLGPVAVLPARQRQGIGSLLVATGLDECRRAGHTGVVVLGHPTYYPRFGFKPASRYGLQGDYAVPDDVFMAIELHPGALQGRAGHVKYQPEFQAV